MEWIWLKTLASLLLILGLIIGTMWMLKKFMTFSKPAAGGGIAMEIAGVLHLGPRRAVYAVKAGGQVLLLGVAEHGITYLTQLPESAQTTGTGAAMGTISPIGAAAPFFTLLTERFTRRVNTAEENRPEPTPEIPEPVRKTKSSAAPRKKAANPI